MATNGCDVPFVLGVSAAVSLQIDLLLPIEAQKENAVVCKSSDQVT
jgi:hypothetical protein